ncbi:MAG: tRNA modification GTPase MnmE [Legionellaceae bacterium]
MQRLNNIIHEFNTIYTMAKEGAILKEGVTVVIAGKPNAGKSSLLNSLTGKETAIVTSIPGTTRDVLREYIAIDGIPLHVIDTAGLRESEDIVEQEGIRRAWNEITNADYVMLVIDSELMETNKFENLLNEFQIKLTKKIPLIVIRNKIDLTQEKPELISKDNITFISLSAKTGEGLSLLKEHLKKSIGVYSNFEGRFIARRRHLDALERAHKSLLLGQQQLLHFQAIELLAEELRHGQQALNEITGEFTTEDLLGKIFNSFCIGK